MIVNPKKPEQLTNLLKSRQLVLYGMGGTGLRIAEWCDEQGVDYIFADRDAKKKQKGTNKTVVLPEVLKNEYSDANIIVSSIIYCDEIAEQLLKMGYKPEQILSYKLFMPENIVWSDLDDNIDWDLMRFRVQMFSKWIDEDIKSIADYGAGKMFLKEYLTHSTKYYPIDYIRRTDETIMCDLNLGNFPNIQTDATICSGVLEFITTSESLLKHVCANTNKIIIMSYLTVDKFSSIDGRRTSAYISDLTHNQIIDIMLEGGFSLVKNMPDPVNELCTVYLFKKINEIR